MDLYRNLRHTHSVFNHETTGLMKLAYFRGMRVGLWGLIGPPCLQTVDICVLDKDGEIDLIYELWPHGPYTYTSDLYLSGRVKENKVVYTASSVACF